MKGHVLIGQLLKCFLLCALDDNKCVLTDTIILSRARSTKWVNELLAGVFSTWLTSAYYLASKKGLT